MHWGDNCLTPCTSSGGNYFSPLRVAVNLTRKMVRQILRKDYDVMFLNRTILTIVPTGCVMHCSTLVCAFSKHHVQIARSSGLYNGALCALTRTVQCRFHTFRECAKKPPLRTHSWVRKNIFLLTPSPPPPPSLIVRTYVTSPGCPASLRTPSGCLQKRPRTCGTPGTELMKGRRRLRQIVPQMTSHLCSCVHAFAHISRLRSHTILTVEQARVN